MAQTFIGQLVLKLRDEMSGKAKAAAKNLDTSVERIQATARKLNSTSWGGQFEERLRKLGTSAGDIDKLRGAWDSLHTSMTSRNLGKAMQTLEKSNFKTAAISHFGEIATKADEADKAVGRFHSRWKTVVADIAAYGGVSAIVYGGINALRGGINASAEYQRELWRQESANLSTTDRTKIASRADMLTTQYPSAGIVDVMEMARAARNMMGDTDRGLAVLPDLVKGLVALQSAKGVDAAPEELSRLLRAIDNSGKNAEGDLGIKDTREIIAGLIRAAQIEGNEINVGDMWTFMRRAKIAGPGFSTEFLANIAPALIQDMTAPSAGTALSSAFQAFVIGSNAVASKKNIAEQVRLGIRKNGKLVNSQLMGENPYEWAKQVLLPALEKDGVDINNDTALSEAIAHLSRNTPATAMLTKMLQQREQIDKTIGLYRNAIGLDAADQAMAKDPLVAWKGFVESWRELATAIQGMPEAIGILNSLTSGLQSFATALRNNDGGAQALLAGAGLGGLFGAYKITGMVYGLISAGTNLNAAATALEIAAAKLAGGGVGDLVDGPGKKKAGIFSKIGAFLPWLGRASVPAGAAVATYEALDSIPREGYESALKDNPNLFVDMERDRRLRAEYPGGFEGGMHTVGAGLGPKPGSWDSAVADARNAGQEIQSALNVTATPNVDNAALRETLRLVNAIQAGLQGLGGAVQNATSSVANNLNRSYADFGVKP